MAGRKQRRKIVRSLIKKAVTQKGDTNIKLPENLIEYAKRQIGKEGRK